MRKLIRLVASVLLLSLVFSQAVAEVIDPKTHILKNGYHSVTMGDDGKARIYSFTERATSPRIAALEAEIERLPKNAEVYKLCDFFRGGTKALLIKQRGVAIDVAVTNYGYTSSTLACVLKYMQGNKVGTQLIYSGKGTADLYMVFVTD